MTTAMITGHRKVNHEKVLIGLNYIFQKLPKIEMFYSGMALGTDQLFVEYLNMKGQKWCAVLPNADQSNLWTPDQKKYYRKLLAIASDIVTIADKFSVDSYHLRNDFMIDHSDICIAIYDGRDSGGTHSTVNKAIKKGLRTIVFNPLTMLTHEYKQLTLF